MGIRPRTKFVQKLKARRCTRCDAKLGRQDTRCKRCHVTQARPKKK